MSNRNLETSPVGSIQFMAAQNPVKETSGKTMYSVKLAFDLKDDKEFLDKISKINEAKVVTEKTYRGKSEAMKAVLKTGKALVSASSKFKPTVYDASGNELEEAPYFFADSTGTAQMIVQPYQGDKGGTINLIGLILHTLENPEGTGGATDRETRLAQLREQVALHTK